MPNPPTATDAIKQGHTELFGDDQAHALKKYGALTAFANNPALPPGQPCAESNCFDGYKIVQYPDNNGDCTRYFRIPC
jgi:hypothetical protein